MIFAKTQVVDVDHKRGTRKECIVCRIFGRFEKSVESVQVWYGCKIQVDEQVPKKGARFVPSLAAFFHPWDLNGCCYVLGFSWCIK